MHAQGEGGACAGAARVAVGAGRRRRGSARQQLVGVAAETRQRLARRLNGDSR